MGGFLPSTWVGLPVVTRAAAAGAAAAAFRAPCVPLDVATPYQSTWSCHDNLTDGSPQHWTGDSLDWVGLVRVGSTVYRWLGQPILDLPAALQKSVEVRPTTTRYTFQAGSAEMIVDFMTPSFGHDEACWLWQPDMSATTATKSDKQEVVGIREVSDTLQAVRVGTTEQHVLGQTSDRSDWGYRYVAAPSATKTVIHSAAEARQAFVNGSYSKLQDEVAPKAAGELALSVQVDHASSSRIYLMFDEVVAQRFFGTELMPLWRRNGAAIRALEAAEEAAESRWQQAQAWSSRWGPCQAAGHLCISLQDAPRCSC
eukprot:s3487_g4.t1